MEFLASDNSNPLHDFVAISQWQSLVSIVIFFGLMVLLWIFIKKTKIRFMYRVIIGLVIGLGFGTVVQAINGFPYNSDHPSSSMIDPWVDPNVPNPVVNPIYQLWVQELSIWVNLFKMIFINAILMLTVPVVFLAIARAVARPGHDKKTRQGIIITVIILLVNVAVAFTITFFIGWAFKIGDGFTISGSGNYDGDAFKPLPQIIWEYVPSNFIGAFIGIAIIPVMVIGALIGLAVKKSAKKHPEDMQKIRDGFERWWTIVMSCLMFVIKLMPYAVMSMITYSIISRPIGYLGKIGIVIGVAYLCLVVALIWHTITLVIFGINPVKWWKHAIRPLIQGFSTQSSNAALPITMDTLKNNIKVKESLVGILHRYQWQWD
ncbi:cation:dicarboxylate symporter family transporter [Spiroplasma eriocheiris]|uniref:cation:dicarboxylate symporter family transporter n=1 Tax=Spiroplasma eriocheiris TaxID=315358 RepID=UPI000AF5FE4E|nr:cation:dicarboxylase symporter family transporter [Spiroplasma eriocheiris]